MCGHVGDSTLLPAAATPGESSDLKKPYLIRTLSLMHLSALKGHSINDVSMVFLLQEFANYYLNRNQADKLDLSNKLMSSTGWFNLD